MSSETPPVILIYTGHSELIGGDVHYTFDLVNGLVRSGYEVKILTDINKLFLDRANAWLKVDVPIEYIDTKPRLFSKDFIEKFYDDLEREDSKNQLGRLKKMVFKLFSKNIFLRPLYWYVKVFIRFVTFYYLRNHISNILIFINVFKNNQKNIDIFHFNNGGYPAKTAGLIGLMVAKFYGVNKTVMSVHNIARKRFLPSDIIFDFIVRKCCNKIITASDRVKSELLLKRKISSEICQTIRCGLEDVELLSKKECAEIKTSMKLSNEKRILLISGNYEEDRKGHRPLLEAIEIVKREISDVLLLIVGTGSKERRLLLESDISRLKIEQQTLLLGYRTDIFELNSVADICLTPSIGDESIPYTIIEAARIGKPVITTTVGGCAEAVNDAETGFVVAPNDVNMLSNRIIKLLKNNDLLESMGKQSRNLFIDRFLLEKRIIEHIEIYNKHN